MKSVTDLSFYNNLAANEKKELTDYINYVAEDMRDACNEHIRIMTGNGIDKQRIVDLFHKHLDVCKQCREHPFNHCPEGIVLLNASAGGAT